MQQFLPEGVEFNRDLTYLATTNFRNKEQVFGIKRKDRRQHVYILGKSGTGKSTMLGNMIVQDLWNGEGIAVVDPHGELVESILATIPPHRVKDVIYFNPADHDYHIGFNVLQVADPRYKHLVASGLMGIFTKIWANVWSSRMEYIMNNAILALIDTPGSTLLGIPRLLVDKDYRQMIVNNLKDPVIKSFWVHEYESWRDQFRNEAIAPIQNKVGQFLSSSIIRNVVGQSESTIDIFDAMNSGKIFLVNVSKGRIGEDNSSLLGGMLITKLQLAAMERVRIPEDQRKDFYLYVDEFQNFVTDSFASILSEARKYRLCLTLAHQYIAQLTTKDSDTVRDAIFGNVGTMISYRVGATDADYLEKEFEPEFIIQDMVNLPNFHIYLKLMVDGITSRPFSAKILPPFKVPTDFKITEQIIESSRKLYARPREIVEREIMQWSGMQSMAGEGEGKFKAVCSSCGKETMVPFEPEPGRPVYCRDCIAKIKSGELKPLKGTKGKDLSPQSFSALANLGIEFPRSDAPAAAPRPRPAFQRPARTPGAPLPSSIPEPQASEVRTVSAPRPTSPRPATPAAQPRPVPKPADSEGLKSILKQALGDAIKKGEEFKEKKNAELEVPKTPMPEKPTISLSSLKHSAAESKAPTIASKNASEGRVSALQEAIARARESAKVSKPSPEHVSDSQEKEPVIDEKVASAPSSKSESEAPSSATTSTKTVKEIPEDILRKVLE